MKEKGTNEAKEDGIYVYGAPGNAFPNSICSEVGKV
jgi:hypothetical protein